jgi:hypothetical protein
MKNSARVLLATGSLVVLLRLLSLTRHADATAAAAGVWTAALGLLAGIVWFTVGTAERVGTVPIEETRQRVYALTFALLMIVALALGANAYLGR